MRKGFSGMPNASLDPPESGDRRTGDAAAQARVGGDINAWNSM